MVMPNGGSARVHGHEQPSGLEALLSLFSPATPADRALMKFFGLSLHLGATPNARPAFILEAAPGTRAGAKVGKLAFVRGFGKLVGGAASIDPKLTDREVGSRLTTGQTPRLAHLDLTRRDQLPLEFRLRAFVECSDIVVLRRGKRPISRPNVVTWAISVGGELASKDLVNAVPGLKAVVIHFGPVEFA